jgi:membrane-associated phospholipid phosphatase
VLAVLVDTGATNGLDRYAIRVLQPLADTNWIQVTLPADPLVASGLMLLAVAALVCRGRRRDGLALGLALLLGFGIEIAGKLWVHQIQFNETERVFDLVSFPGSFPSGHALRTVLLAAAAIALAPALRWLVVAWALATLGMIEASGMHVPTDIAGGVLAALALLALLRSPVRDRSLSSHERVDHQRHDVHHAEPD